MMVRRELYLPCGPSYVGSDDRMFPDSDYNDYFDAGYQPSYPKLVGLYDENLRSLEDWDFAIRASLKGWKVFAIQEVLHEARVHPGRVSEHSDRSQLYAKYSYMILYTVIGRGLDAMKQLFTRPKLLLHKVYNKGAVRILHAYPRPEPPTNRQHSWVNEGSILRRIRSSKPSTILDCGCGEGRWGYLLKGKTVIGVDTHKPYLQQAKRFEQVICASVTWMPFQSKSFDAGLAVELIEHLPKQEGPHFLRELKRSIRGRVVLTTPKVFVPINFGASHPDTHRSLWERTEIMACIAQQ